MAGRLWMKMDTGIAHSPKVARTAKRLGVTRAQAVGHLTFLWGWAANYAECGYVEEYDAADLARAAEWDGDADQFVGALIVEGWLDEDGDDENLRLHEWESWAGAGVTSRAKSRERTRTVREQYAHGNSHVTAKTETKTETETEKRATPAATLSTRKPKSEAQRLTEGYVALVPLSNFVAVLGIVKKAVPHYPAAEIEAALARLAADGRGVTTETLRVELDGLPATRSRHPVDQRIAKVQALMGGSE